MNKKGYKNVQDLLDFYSQQLSAPLLYQNLSGCPYLQNDKRETGYNELGIGKQYIPNSYYLSVYKDYPHVLIIYNGHRRFLGKFLIDKKGSNENRCS